MHFADLDVVVSRGCSLSLLWGETIGQSYELFADKVDDVPKSQKPMPDNNLSRSSLAALSLQ